MPVILCYYDGFTIYDPVPIFRAWSTVSYDKWGNLVRTRYDGQLVKKILEARNVYPKPIN